MYALSVENVPAELRDPFYCDQYEQEHLKPPVTRLLQSSELYCRTYSLIVGETASEAQPKDNASLLQVLTQRGIVPKDKEATVTDADLRHKPIKMVMFHKYRLCGFRLGNWEIYYILYPKFVFHSLD